MQFPEHETQVLAIRNLIAIVIGRRPSVEEVEAALKALSEAAQ